MMTGEMFVLASLAGGIGAALRYGLDAAVTALLGRSRRRASSAGVGIVMVNVTGSFALGFVTAALPEALWLLGAGLLGGYTTFSTAMLDAVELWRAGRRPASLAHLLGTFGASVAAGLLGLALGSLAPR